MLDNTVAGGIVSGDSPFETIVRECGEEASLPRSLVMDTVRATGIVSYSYRTPDGWLQPELQYVYDMRLPEDGSVRPAPFDAEVENFELLDMQDVVKKMLEGEFKPNCALVLVDWLIRSVSSTSPFPPHYVCCLTCTSLILGMGV
jgi:8-oxo-dGTP pyrophosphatase MutT (NUDIX family)